jgi:hypothetical protein
VHGICRFLAHLPAPLAQRLGVWALAQLGLEVAGAVATAGLLLLPSPNRIRVEGEIKGLPGGRYSWNRDESELHITYQTADGQRRTFTAQLKDNQFLGPDGQVVGRVLPQGNVTIETDALPGRPANDNEPKLCPLPQPDKRTNDKGLAYEAFMRPRINPTMPTPLGFGYYLTDPSTDKPVEFDDCQQMTGIMVDYKHRYWMLLSNPKTQWFTIEKLWKQALDQVYAAGERKIRWYFAERKAADYVRDLFNEDHDRRRIDIVHEPMPESAE